MWYACGAGRVDHHLALDRAAVGLDARDAAVLHDDVLDGRLGLKPHAQPPGVGDVRHREVGRLQIAVGRAPQHGLRAVEVHQRPLLSGPRALSMKSASRPASSATAFIRWNSATRSGAERDPQRADLPPAGLGRLVALAVRENVSTDHMASLRPLDGVADLADESGRLRRGDRRDGRLLFQEQHVGLAGLGQAVRDGAADGAAADDDNLCVLRYRSPCDEPHCGPES